VYFRLYVARCELLVYHEGPGSGVGEVMIQTRCGFLMRWRRSALVIVSM
jgi:hypothetical protein